ncbi:MAG: hypothetical protein U0R51_10110 [Solirubrobacterales bacterium]
MVLSALVVLAIAGSASATTVQLSAEGSNGYRLHIKASDARRPRARVELKKNHSIAFYIRKRDVVISKRRLAFDLGPRGSVDLRFHERTTKSCGGKVRSRRGVFRGRLRFAGENGYTQVDASNARGEVVLRGRCGGSGLPPFLQRRPGRRAGDEEHYLFGCGPEPRTPYLANGSDEFFWGLAFALEKQPWARITRVAVMAGDPSSLRVSENGKRATLRPSGGRFHGVAHFAHRRTTGNLTADFPGRPGVPLVPGPAVLDDFDSPDPPCLG